MRVHCTAGSVAELAGGCERGWGVAGCTEEKEEKEKRRRKEWSGEEEGQKDILMLVLRVILHVD